MDGKRCDCPRDYAQYFGDDPHNRWCPMSRNPMVKPVEPVEPPEPDEAEVRRALDKGIARTWREVGVVVAAAAAWLRERERKQGGGA